MSGSRWAVLREETRHLAVGYFGASTGAAAALIAETRNQGTVHAVVSRGGRSDLAGQALERIRAPTLLIVGGNDHQVIALNEQAMKKITAAKEMVIVPGATHLFEEPGTLESVGRPSIVAVVSEVPRPGIGGTGRLRSNAPTESGGKI